LTKLTLFGGFKYISVITKFTNLQELIFIFYHIDSFEGFKELQYVTFSQLQKLEFRKERPRDEFLIKFLENNGRNLKNLHITKRNNSLNLAIDRFCSNLKLSTNLI